jgi:hypothetical protein
MPINDPQFVIIVIDILVPSFLPFPIRLASVATEIQTGSVEKVAEPAWTIRY